MKRGSQRKRWRHGVLSGRTVVLCRRNGCQHSVEQLLVVVRHPSGIGTKIQKRLQAFFGRFELLKNGVHGGFVHDGGGEQEANLLLSLKSRSGRKVAMVLKSWEFWTAEKLARGSPKILNVEVGTTRSFLPVQNYDIHGHNNGGFEGIALSFALLDFPIKRTR